ncbi:hypothetical protein ACFSB1_14695 [Halopseudomonas phragmitis]|uniref:hypothetical protein n=1 Tax=Halopseudomonas phragmitis TaxID=1931241 RepID=UPI0012BAAA04|nr:hypothetical protein [Halopseudomonas phragmitis]
MNKPLNVFNRYPDQSRSRKGYALIGTIFLVFGIGMVLIGSVAGALIGFCLGSGLLLPSVLLGYARFEKYEKILGRISGFGSFSS